jgi:hypothetical protein
MNRRTFARNIGYSALLASVGASSVGCSTKSLTAWAGTVVSFLEQTLPYFQDLLPSSVAVLTKAIQVAKDLKAALSAGSENAIELLNQLLAPNGLFQQILADVGTISGPQQKIISGILAIAGVALNIIATALSQGAAGAPQALVARVKAKNAIGTSMIENAAKSDRLEKALAALKK